MLLGMVGTVSARRPEGGVLLVLRTSIKRLILLHTPLSRVAMKETLRVAEQEELKTGGLQWRGKE